MDGKNSKTVDTLRCEEAVLSAIDKKKQQKKLFILCFFLFLNPTLLSSFCLESWGLFRVWFILLTLSMNESHLSAYSKTISGSKCSHDITFVLYDCQDTDHLRIPLLKMHGETSAAEFRRKEGSFLFASSETLKTDAIRFTAGWRPGPDTLSTGFCPLAARLENHQVDDWAQQRRWVTFAQGDKNTRSICQKILVINFYEVFEIDDFWMGFFLFNYFISNYKWAKW